MTLFTTIILKNPGYNTLWLFGIANSIFYPMIFVPLTTISYNVIRNNPKTVDYQAELLTFREIPLNTGRILGIILLVVFLHKGWPAEWLLWGLGLSQLPIGYILKRVSKKA